MGYIIAVLQKAADGNNLDVVDGETQAESIIAHFDKLGVSYKEAHSEFCAGVLSSQQTLANWRPEDFKLRLRDDKLFDAVSQEPVQGNYQDELQADKLLLQNYGRPYDSNGKPSGSFYKHAKTEPIADF